VNGLPLLLFPRTDPEERCIECGIHLNWCEECQVIWAGSHICRTRDPESGPA
jgi:hypothetical protein